MNSSLLWIAIVAMWLFVLLPMLLRGRPEVKKTTAAAQSTRVLHRGGTATAVRRRSATRHPSNPDYVVKRAARVVKSETAPAAKTATAKTATAAEIATAAKTATEKKTAAGKPAVEETTAGTPAAEQVVAEKSVAEKSAAEKSAAEKSAAEKSTTEKTATKVAVQRVAQTAAPEMIDENPVAAAADGASSESGRTESNPNEVTDVIDVSGNDKVDPQQAGPEEAETDLVTADEVTADEAADEVTADEAGAPEADTDVDADAEAAAEVDDEWTDLDDDLADEADTDLEDETTLDEDSDLDDDTDLDEDAEIDEDTVDEDAVDEDAEAPAKPKRAPKPKAVPRELRGRGGYGPDRASERAALRYRERQRVVIGLSVLTLLAVASCFLWTIFGIVATVLSVAALATYLMFLRRTAIREAEFRAQRAARLKRQAAQDERLRREQAQPTYRPAPPQLRRPGGAVVLEADDEDPAFDHLPTVDLSYARHAEPEVDREYRHAG